MGILGDEHRHTCTAISASVNLASRLEGLTKQLGCRILASDAIVQQLSTDQLAALPHRRIGPAVVKGASKDVVVYDLFQTDERGLQRYKAATKTTFEEFGAALLRPAAERDGTRVAALEASLAAAAAEYGTHVADVTVCQMKQFASDTTGSLSFDEK